MTDKTVTTDGAKETDDEDENPQIPDRIEIDDNTLRKLHQEYAEYVIDRYNNDRTAKLRKNGVRYFLSWCKTDELDPIEATENDIRRYVDENLLGISDPTAASHFSSVSMFYEWATVHKPIDDNPTANISLSSDYDISTKESHYVRVLRRKGKENVKAINKSRVEKLFDHVPSPKLRNELILKIAWYTGLRADEISRIKIDNMNVAERKIRIRSSKISAEDSDLYHRYVFYSDSLDGLLREWMNKGRYEMSPYADDSPYLFLTDQSEQMRPSHISRIIKQAAHNAGEQEPLYDEDGNGNTRWLITAHRIRHSAISYWANECEELNLNAIRKMAGHKNLSTTQDYITTGWDDIRENYQSTID